MLNLDKIFDTFGFWFPDRERDLKVDDVWLWNLLHEFSIFISEPINLIHLESTDVNGEIDIVRVGIDWPDDVIEESDTNESEGVILDELAAVEEGSISMPLLIVIGIIAAYITVILLMKKGDALSYSSEEE